MRSRSTRCAARRCRIACWVDWRRARRLRARSVADDTRENRRRMNRYDLTGRTAIVTGGAGGIGLGVARHLLAAGSTVELWDRDAAGLARVAPSLASGKVVTRAVDITDAGAI